MSAWSKIDWACEICDRRYVYRELVTIRCNMHGRSLTMCHECFSVIAEDLARAARTASGDPHWTFPLEST